VGLHEAAGPVHEIQEYLVLHPRGHRAAPEARGRAADGVDRRSAAKGVTESASGQPSRSPMAVGPHRLTTAPVRSTGRPAGGVIPATLRELAGWHPAGGRQSRALEPSPIATPPRPNPPRHRLLGQAGTPPQPRRRSGPRHRSADQSAALRGGLPCGAIRNLGPIRGTRLRSYGFPRASILLWNFRSRSDVSKKDMSYFTGDFTMVPSGDCKKCTPQFLRNGLRVMREVGVFEASTSPPKGVIPCA
jgi:hypothetical protein